MTLPDTADVLEGRWTGYVLRRLEELEAGEDRELWEGRWPSLETIRAARNVAARTFPLSAPTPSVVPGEDGCVLFVWMKGGWTIEVEVDQHLQATFWTLQQGQTGSNLSGSLEEHGELLGRILGDLGDLRQ